MIDPRLVPYQPKTAGPLRARVDNTRLLDQEGRPVGLATRVVTTTSRTSGAALAWTGEFFGMALNVGEATYFVRVGSDGRALSPMSRLDAHSSIQPRIAWTGRNFAIAYSGSAQCAASHCADVLLAASDGTVLLGPTALTAQETDEVRLTWIGGELAVSWDELILPGGAVRLSTLDADTLQVLSTIDIARPSNAQFTSLASVAWTGREYGVLWQHQPQAGAPEQYLTTALCCRDLDRDGVSLCSDCDDGNAAMFPGNVERCDRLDNDCNGRVDDGAGPPDITRGLLFADETTLKWSAEPGADVYDVVRGSLTQLLLSGDFGSSVQLCLENDGTDTVAHDGWIPPAADGAYYLVRSVGCGGQPGSYDEDPTAQTGRRDAAINSSQQACP